MNYLRFVFLCMFSFQVQAQELFVVTEPASNMPTGSVGIRLGQSFMRENFRSGYGYQVSPEIMWGVNRNLMVHAAAYLSNSSNQFTAEGGSLYAKYRFFSVDDIQSHFRMAVFGRYSRNNSIIRQEEIETMGNNSGYETGLIFTQLIKKTAISSTISFEKALDNKPDYNFPLFQSSNAINYSLSFGRLMYPKKYTSFKQTNVNAMVEFVGQTLSDNGRSYLDVVPSIQFIINSQARVDVAYKKELYSSMLRSDPNGFYLKLEYTFFNVSQ
ncbi:hypothetical protein [Flavobacterium sp. LB2P44]|uniref:hypothetical protein n=1 Tax=Flavobacterium sp. LB2P44 TaxID=3401713 RepID=UPI003AAA7ABE